MASCHHVAEIARECPPLLAVWFPNVQRDWFAHKECAYYDTQKDKLDQENLYDRWVPLDELGSLMSLALDMSWDNKYDAELHLIAILRQEVIYG